jgi:hypothetical protein
MKLRIKGEESMTKKKNLLCIVFVCLVAIISMSTADVADSYSDDSALSFLSGQKAGFVLSPFIEQAGNTSSSPPQVIVMPISVGITVPFSITINIFCTDPSCTDFVYSSAFDNSYSFEYDGSEFEEYLSNVDFDELLALLFADISGSGDVDMDAYNTFFLDSMDFIEENTGTHSRSDVDIGTLSDQYVELYNKYYGKM